MRSAPVGPLDDIRVISKDAKFLFAAWRQAYILDFRDTPTIRSLDAAVVGKREMHKQHPDGIVVLNLLASESPLPSSEVRDYAARKQTEDPGGVSCHATVVDGRGFWAGTMRSMMATLFLVGRSPFPRKVFSTVDEAAAWQATVVRGGRPWAQGLVDAVSRIRAMQ